MIRRAARIAAACLAGTLLAGGPGAAELAPDASLRPVARGQVVRGMVLPAEIFVQRDIAHEVALQALSAARDPERAETLGVTRRLPDPDTAPRVALRPHLRPATVVQQGRRAAALRQQGAVCGDLALQGWPSGASPRTPRAVASIRRCGCNRFRALRCRPMR